MGWKSVRDHYRIGHIVQVVGDDLLIGSGYVSDLVRITPEGRIVENRIFRREGDLGRYVDEMEADRPLLLDLMARKDGFERSIPVYGWSGSTIVEDACEEFGWPNVTHSGWLMYDNTFFLDREDAIRRAILSARSRIESWAERVEEAQRALVEKTTGLDRARLDLVELAAAHPGIAAEVADGEG
jgi:hypothetical protein